MKSKTFKSEYSDMTVEVYDSGYVVLNDNEGEFISLGKPPNARIDLILKAIDYVKSQGDKK